MNLTLRQRHRRIFAVIGVLLPLAFVLGIAARKPVPSAVSLPMELAGRSPAFAATIWERSDLFAKTPIQIRLLREHAEAGRFAVAFSAGKEFVKPDLIIYWVAGNPEITDKVPDDALLLGAFNPGSAIALPPDAESSDHVIVLYSLADQEIVAVSKPFTLNKP
jgi:hypothetical protein